jgi:glutamate racemase
MLLGLFDSGIGGLTVVRELLKRHPRASFVYLGDTARAPYGNKTEETIRQYAIEDAAFLLGQGATHIAVACNTASAVALDALRQTFPRVTFLDVISPTVEAVQNKDKKIGVIGTRATIRSGTYEKELKEKLPDADIYSVACPLFVPIVEENWITQPETKKIVRRYLSPLKQQQIDALILGCTHYPLLQDVIRMSLQKRVRIIDSPSAMLDKIGREIPELITPSDEPRQDYFFTDLSLHTERIASRWLKRNIEGLLATLP